ncbi:NADH-quinone oxidoreductase subunit L [Magnetofaba australis]|uniref:Putative proton-translocating NADH-quinone oxidoreductase subunit L n=1 Tax=Magnetofaba australis IT-1 TaxID=1434232 RepID=A0A1Y2K7C6_9PROT|nr:NADH-quinone oxidoreductase subunit L [Magnetofaba australis]OSM06227.1 putative proton-translocating NADH-quinone oxidoreductase subunit L [Magnetofaba australis IT-1]
MSTYKLIVLLPLMGSIIAGLFGRRLGNQMSQIVTIGGIGLALLLSIKAFFEIALGDAPAVHETFFTWIPSGDFVVTLGVLVDRLTAIMLIVVTGVSTLVHIYSVNYMEEDPDVPRFFSYLSLFSFAMLSLVTAPNFLQLFFGWEGVGLASYLLIGFWFKKESACNAAIKAFLVNRVGDFGFALGVFGVFMVFGTLDFLGDKGVFAMALTNQYQATMMFLGHEFNTMTLICLLLFMGAMGKSAQFFLHTWLPDAMEGPTPVSALIHAATMVTAGVFLVCRASPLFEQSETALMVVTVIGAVTAIFAASVGLVQNDIKRVIAYSTCSQLGYMFFAAGVSAYAASMFHLMTHAFFKALLFLGAGAVIHAMHHEQDMRKMGGLWKKIPLTYALMMIGTLALTGFPYLAGWWSKDAILESAWAAHTGVGTFAWVIGLIAAFMTTFYSFRLVFMTFHGKPHDEHHYDHAHEAPWFMRAPNLLLAVGALLAGYLGHGIIEAGWFKDAIFLAEGHDALAHAHHAPAHVKWLPFVMFLGGLFLALLMYIWVPTLPKKVSELCPRGYQFLLNAWYFDKLYDAIFIKPAKAIGKGLWQTGDATIIDGYGVNGTANLMVRMGAVLKRMQSGYVYHYAFAMLAGVLVLITFYA